jgi:uncharacterized protein YndB with AHSA1/START domain
MSSETGAHVATIATPGEREILTERVFDAPRALVWRAFTEPELIARWWGLRGSTTVVDQQDLKAGGAWRFVQLQHDRPDAAFRGIYREIVPPERLVYTFEWEGLPGYVLIDTATFEDLGERTRVTMHSLFHTGGERDNMLAAGMERGLNQGYEMLDELLVELAR